MGNTFDERAATWDENPRRIKLIENVWEVLEQQLDFNAIQTVLDYGCGTGLLGYKMAERVNQITFCDTSKPMLEQVEKKRKFYGYENVKTLCSDFTKDVLPKEKYNLILSMLVLHHVKDIQKIIASFSQLLNPSGLFCWIDLDEEDGSFHLHDGSIPHHGFGKTNLENLMLHHHLEMVFYTNELRILKEIEGELKEFPLFVMIAEKLTI